MRDGRRLSEVIDEANDAFTSGVKARLLPRLGAIDEAALEWLIMEHYQFSYANKGLLNAAVACTAALAEPGVTAELQRNVDEEDGHAPMYKQGMLDVGTDMDDRVEFAPTTDFLARVRSLCSPDPSRALGALYATETAAIFEHETFFEVCREICDRRGATYEGSLIKHFHDIHLSGGVEQGHKDGLAAFVDTEGTGGRPGQPIDPTAVHRGALDAIDAMQTWWDALLDHTLTPATTR
jgi:hypothetical protein